MRARGSRAHARVKRGFAWERRGVGRGWRRGGGARVREEADRRWITSEEAGVRLEIEAEEGEGAGSTGVCPRVRGVCLID